MNVEVELVQRRGLAPRRIMKGHLLEHKLAACRNRQPDRNCRGTDLRFRFEEFCKPFRGAGGAEQVPEDFGEGADRSCK